MLRRMINWILFTVLFGLLPLIIFWIINYVFDYNINSDFNFVSELFFFTTILSSGTLKEIFDNKLLNNGNGTFYLASFLSLLLIVIISALLYGIMIISDIYINIFSTIPININDQKITLLSIILSLGSFIIGTLVQLLEGIQDNDKNNK